MNKNLFALLLMMPILLHSQNPQKPLRQGLNDGWQFRQVGKPDWLAVKVPNSVHSALLSNGMIPDPFFGTNENDVQWIEKADWEFERTIDLDAATFNRKHIELIFHGLDTYADVFLNGNLILEADNMFQTYRVDVKKHAQMTGNKLRVLFKSPVEMGKKEWKALPYELPGGPRTVTRKAQFHYGWDWGPRLVGCGIWQNVEMQVWDDFIIDEAFYFTRKISDEVANLVCQYTYRSDIEGAATMFLRNNNDKNKQIEGRTLEIGEHLDSATITVREPKLWWCRGLGEPNLYDFTLEIKGATSVLDKKDSRVGIRLVELVQTPDDKGKSFYFKLNGKPVFAKGANYIPQDIFQDRVTPTHYRKLFDDVCESNFNMLRVWGGGIYETDLFYQMADARGIMVWQDFMFACAMYPGSGKFFKSVAAETFQQISRLREHPSVVLFCGNNENNEAWHNWGWQQQFNESERKSLWRQYQNIFTDLLPIYMENYAPGIPYWESSPSFGRADKRSMTEGDSHYWGVWHDEKPFDEFEKVVPRFMSEYGFQSFPDWATIESFTKPEDRVLDSKVMLLHQKHPRGNALIAEYMKRDYRVPKKNFEHFTYVSQLLQAEGMRKGIEAHRRAKPYCMGTLYWQLNDVYPVASWASRDNFGRWKALQYFAKEAYSPVVALPKVEDNTLKIWVSSDLPTDTIGDINIDVLDFDGKLVFSEKAIAVKITEDSSRMAYQVYLPTLLKDNKITNVAIEISIKIGEKLASRRIFYLSPIKDLLLPFVEIKKTVEQVNDGYLIKLSSDKLAKNVRLISPIENGWFSDNYFDLLPGRAVEVLLKTDRILDNPTEQVKVISLVDTF